MLSPSMSCPVEEHTPVHVSKEEGGEYQGGTYLPTYLHRYITHWTPELASRPFLSDVGGRDSSQIHPGNGTNFGLVNAGG
jgi:hypothetical protein